MGWQEELRSNITTAEELQELFQLTDDDTKKMAGILERYPMSVSRYYLSLINKEDQNDPIRKMSMPSLLETDMSGTFDTSGEQYNTKLTGLQHKYTQTALILSTHVCAMYCRHCFRKRLVGLSEDEIADNFDEIADYIKQHTEISNVLISGGDAFLNSNSRIERYLKNFAELEHLDLIRFGTRTPVVLPSRINDDPELVEILEKYNKKKQIYVVTQFNHPNELTEEAITAVKKLMDAGIVVKNQVVLLRGINDVPEVLAELINRFTAIGILPYYVFQCRPVTGVKNQFQIPLREGYRIVDKAKSMMSGQGKCFRYCMSHVTGKIEILGIKDEKYMYFSYHEAKNPDDYGKVHEIEIAENQCWLD